MAARAPLVGAALSKAVFWLTAVPSGAGAGAPPPPPSPPLPPPCPTAWWPPTWAPVLLAVVDESFTHPPRACSILFFSW